LYELRETATAEILQAQVKIEKQAEIVIEKYKLLLSILNEQHYASCCFCVQSNCC